MHTPPPQSIDLSKVQAGDELDVGFRLLAHRAELAFRGALQASPQGRGGCGLRRGRTLGDHNLVQGGGVQKRAQRSGPAMLESPVPVLLSEKIKSYSNRKNHTRPGRPVLCAPVSRTCKDPSRTRQGSRGAQSQALDRHSGKPSLLPAPRSGGAGEAGSEASASKTMGPFQPSRQAPCR